MSNPRSTARVGGHPVHPMLVPFPIAFWLGTLFCDIAYVSTARADWAVASMWLVGGGLLFALLAAVFGFIDFIGEERIRQLRHAWEHMIGNLVAAVLAAISFGMRLLVGAEQALLPWGLVLSFLVAVILLYTGWRGGDLVYRHATGVEQERPRVDTR